MENIRTIEELELLLAPLVADGRTVAAVALVNSLNKDQTNILAVRLVEMILRFPKNDDEARLAIKTLFADQPFRLAAQLVLAEQTHQQKDIFALKVMMERVGGRGVLDQNAKRAAKTLIATLGEVQEQETDGGEEQKTTTNETTEVS